MIEWQEAVRTARALIGTPYASLDCINLVKKVIRSAPGGVRSYTTAGTNSLWNSAGMSAKYRDLTWRQEGIAGATAGMLAFQKRGSDVHHVGLVTDEGTVIHASSARGEVVETPLESGAGWNLLAVHRYIRPAERKAKTREENEAGCVTIVDSAENVFVPVGDFRVLIGSRD